MNLSEESINRFFATLVEIVEEKNDVKIKYRIVEKSDEDEEEN